MEDSRQVWREEFVLGVASLDEQHRAIAEAITDLIGADLERTGVVRDYLVVLQRVVRRHFEMEERWMAQAGYHDEAEHRFQHDYLLHELDHFGRMVAPGRKLDREELATFLLVWFEEHLTEMDRPFAVFLRHGSHRPPRTE